MNGTIKKDIVKSVIKNNLSQISNKIYGRKCKIKSVETDEKNQFLLKNHLQGKDNASISYGLYYNDELVSLMTFGKSRFDKKIEYEMYRFCNKLDCVIIGRGI
jgi:hypothetical protein